MSIPMNFTRGVFSSKTFVPIITSVTKAMEVRGNWDAVCKLK